MGPHMPYEAQESSDEIKLQVCPLALPEKKIPASSGLPTSAEILWK